MGILGIIGIVFTIILTVVFIEDIKTPTIPLVALGIFIALLVWDASSDIETTETMFLTNDFNQYMLHIEGDVVLEVVRTKKDPIRWGAVLKESTTYKIHLPQEN